MEVGLSLGSNLGDRLAMLREACRRIATLPGVRIKAISPAYETEPVDMQPAFASMLFLNAVAILDAESDLDALSGQLHAIESAMGRRRGADRNAPRPIDIDLLYAGETRRDSPELTLPHPRWAERRFVLQPLADVRPNLRLPGSQRTVRETLDALPASGAITRFAAQWLLSA